MLCQTMSYRERGRSGPIVGTGLVENAGQVIDDGLFAQYERCGNLTVAFALDNEAQHFDLPRAEPGRK